MTDLDRKVKKWMEKLGFCGMVEDCKIPRYYPSLRMFLSPSDLVKKVVEENKEFDPLDDGTFITPDIAKLFYLICNKDGNDRNKKIPK